MLRSLTARTVLALGLLALFVGLMFAIVLRGVTQQNQSTDDARASQLRLASAMSQQKLLIDLETGLRGYLITTDRRFLEPYFKARQALPAQQRELRKLEDQPQDAALLARLYDASNDYVYGYAWPLARARVPARRATRTAITARGKRKMDTLREMFQSYVASELAESRATASAARASARQTALLVAGGLASSVLLVLLVAIYQLRSILAPVRRVGAAARRLATGDLSVRVDDRGSGEVAELGESFNLMATSLEYTRDELERQNAELESQQIELETTVNDLAEQKRRVEQFQRFGSHLAAETELEDVAETILGELADRAGADLGALYVLAEETGQAALLSVRALDPARLPLNLAPGDGLLGRALAEGRVLTSSHQEHGLRLPTLGGDVAVTHEAYVPLVYGDRTAGVVALGRMGEVPFGRADLEVVHDLTDRAALSVFAAVALRTARNQAVLNSALIDTAADAFVSVDEHGVLLQWNAAAEQLFGRAADEVIGQPIVDFVIPARLRPDFEEFFHGLVDGEDMSESLSGEVAMRHADGRELTVDATVSQLALGAHRRFNAFLRDVTGRKRLEGYRTAHHRVTRGLAESTSLEEARVAVLDNLGSCLGFSFGATLVPTGDGELTVTGTWSAEDVDLRDLATTGSTLALQRGEGISGRVWDAGEAIFVEDFAAETTPGASREAARASGLRSGVAFPVFSPGRFEGAVLMFWTSVGSPDRDLLATLTAVGAQIGQFIARKRAEEEADRLKDEFFALVSHELRTPLTSIIGYLELVLEDDGVDAQSREFLNVVDRNADRLLRLVGDLLFVVQVEAGRLSLEPAPIDLRSVCVESVEAALPKAEAQGIDLALDAPEVPTTIGDAGRLGQAVDNLVSNALKFTPAGGRVHVSLRTEDGEAVIDVSDTGVGIRDDEQQQLFDRFFRSQSAHEQAVQGVGLGLTIARAIVDGHGGRIRVTSREGRGSTFTIALPLAPAAAELPYDSLPQEVHS